MANEVFKTVQGPAEAVLDSNYLMMTGDLAMQAARKLKIGGDYFDTDDFITKLKGAITGGVVRRNANASPRRSNQRSQANASDDEDADYENNYQDPYVGWDRIGKLATKHTLRVPPIDFMYVPRYNLKYSPADILLFNRLGPLAIPQRKKTVRKKQAREKDVAEKVRPQEVSAVFKATFLGVVADKFCTDDLRLAKTISRKMRMQRRSWSWRLQRS